MPDTELADIAELAASHARLLASLTAPAGLDDGAAREPCRLPGWTRGHLLTHLARNADGMGNVVRWATTGQRSPMYSSPGARAADIEAGSQRPAADLIADVATSSARIAEQMAALAGPALESIVEIGQAPFPVRGAELISMRVREVEIHHVDLDLGYEPADWSPVFAERTLDQLLPRLAAAGTLPVAWMVASDSGRRWAAQADTGWPGGDAEPAGPAGPAHTAVLLELPVLTGPAWALVGWLTGRIPVGDAQAVGLELVGGGDVPSPPAWL